MTEAPKNNTSKNNTTKNSTSLSVKSMRTKPKNNPTASADDDKKQDDSKMINEEDIELTEDDKGHRIIGKWKIMETLGRGGYSWVKRGIDIKSGKVFALKFMER
eukprot:308338_1